MLKSEFRVTAVKDKITVRECALTDCESIYLLNKNDLGYDFPLDKTAKRLEMILKSESDKIFVAEYGGKVIGYIHACDYDVIYGPSMKNILGLAVDSHYRKLRAGKALLTAAENWAKETGSAGVRLCSGAQRKGAHEFYKRCGYICSKEQLNFKKYV